MFDNRDRRRLRRRTRAFAREVVVGEACVFVDHGFQWDGSNNVWLTRARASYVMQAGPSFDLRPRNLWSRVFGARHTALDPYFDAFFVVRTPAPAGTWEALTARARTLLVGSFDDARLVSDGYMVTLWREADFGREADAEAAAELVAEIVTWRTAALDSLRHLPGALYSPASGPWDDREPPHVDLFASVPVALGPVALDGRPVIAAQAPCGRATAPFFLELDDPSLATGWPRAAAPSAPPPGPAEPAAPSSGAPAGPPEGVPQATSPGAGPGPLNGEERAVPRPIDTAPAAGPSTDSDGPGGGPLGEPQPERPPAARNERDDPGAVSDSAPRTDGSRAGSQHVERPGSRSSAPPPGASRGSGRSIPPNLPVSLVAAARTLGAAQLRCDGHTVTLCWRDLETDRERLTSGARLVGTFASENLGGLYR